MIEYLKVKIKSLAAEVAIIRKEEWKAYKRYQFGKNNYDLVAPKETDNIKKTFDGLQSHRRIDVRSEARCAQLAYAFIKGKAYLDVEVPSKKLEKRMCNRLNSYQLTRVATLVNKYGRFYGFGDNPGYLQKV